VRKPDGVAGRVSHLVIDGERVDGTLVPPAGAGAVVRVEAVVEAVAKTAIDPSKNGGSTASASAGASAGTEGRVVEAV
jgi:hypothetical protein